MKKGGRYIVFIPVSVQGEIIEDEDGNEIGSKAGEEKINMYKKYLSEVFEGTEITPKLHSMLGTYSKEKNKEELKAFETDESDDTKFMVVMNKANEGIHIKGVSGLIWFRALDENSKILYLQQLGRAIYAQDEENQELDEERPVIIDLVNNSLSVKMEKDIEKTKTMDDLEALTIIAEWIDEHNRIFPKGDSSSKLEQHYYTFLRKIQGKYSKYVDGFENYEDITEDEKREIQEIVDIATDLDLWYRNLPPIPKQEGEKEEFDPFAVEGILKDYVDMKEEIDEFTKRDSIKMALEIEEWCKKNNEGKEIWEKRVPSEGAKDKDEKKFAKQLHNLKTRLENEYGNDIWIKTKEDIENDEDRRLVEIIRRTIDEYAYGKNQQHYALGAAMNIEVWCREHYGNEKKWNRRLPNKKSEDNEEQVLSQQLVNLKMHHVTPYEGKQLEEIKDEEDRKIVEIIRRTETEFAFDQAQAHYSLGLALHIEAWCKEHFGEKKEWERRLPMSLASDEEEQTMGKQLVELIRERVKKYNNKELEEIENEEDRQIVEIIRRTYDKYAFGQAQRHCNLGIALHIESWCKEHYGNKEKWNRKLPSGKSENQEEQIIGQQLVVLKQNKIKKYKGKKLEEIEDEEDRKVVEIIRRTEEEYAFGPTQIHENLGKALCIEAWCEEKYGDKEMSDRRLPSRDSKDEEERKQGLRLKELKRKLKKYDNFELEEIENKEDRRVAEIIRRVDYEYNGKKLKISRQQNEHAQAKKLNEHTTELEQGFSTELKKRGRQHEQ